MATTTTRAPPRRLPASSYSHSDAGQQLSALDALLAEAQAFEHHHGKDDKENDASWISDRSSEEQDRSGEAGTNAKGKARALDGAERAGRVARAREWSHETTRWPAESPANGQRPSGTATHASQGSDPSLMSSRTAEPWPLEEDSDASPIVPAFPQHRSPSAQSQQPSLSALSGGGHGPGLERWNSTRRYMAQLDADEETESLADGEGNRETWASDPRESMVSQARFGGTGRDGVLRESTMSTMTVASVAEDPFHYSLDEELPSQASKDIRAELAAPTPRRPPHIDTPPQTISHTPSLTSNPIVRIGPSSPTTEAFLADPHSSQIWSDGLVSPSPDSTSFVAEAIAPSPSPADATSVIAPAPTAGRVPSQTVVKNFSRPFMAPRDQPPRPIRSDSVDSLEGNTLQSSLGHSSSIGHSSAGHSSQGAHSLSVSWDERQQFVLRRQEAERQRMHGAIPTSRSGQMEELRDERVYRGMDEGPSRLISREVESPAPFSNPSPKPPSRSPSLQDRFDHSTSHPSLPVSPPRPRISPSNSMPRLPAPLDPTPVFGSAQRPRSPPLASPLSNPRIPPPTPSVTGYSQLTREASYEDCRPRASNGPETSLPRQRNVLRKPRPEQRAPPLPPPAPSNALEDLPPSTEPQRPWARFRSKSKSSGSKTISGVDGTADSRFSHLTTGSTYSQDSFTPTITFQPPSRPVGDLNELAQRARELGAQRRKWDELKLKASVAKSAQAGFVHAGEANVEPAWLETAPSAEGEMERLSPGSSPMMRRTVSDQGPQRLDETASTSTRPPSLYSNYSYYSLGQSSRHISPLASATDDLQFASQQQATRSGGAANEGQAMGTLKKSKAGLKTQPQRTPSGKRAEPETAEDYLQLGIELHENGDLSRAAWSFEQSAKKDGGCGAGMLMWGLTLQHGWGCRVNAPLGFRFLQSAAESVVEDLDRVVAGGRQLSSNERTTKAAQNELVLALHEIGQSFRFGYGVVKDKKLAVAYFTLAADLGDVDAQTDLAFCLANGKGCKKDLKLAAKYYRLAMAQGAPSFGLSWCFKEKYLGAGA